MPRYSLWTVSGGVVAGLLLGIVVGTAYDPFPPRPPGGVTNLTPAFPVPVLQVTMLPAPAATPTLAGVPDGWAVWCVGWAIQLAPDGTIWLDPRYAYTLVQAGTSDVAVTRWYRTQWAIDTTHTRYRWPLLNPARFPIPPDAQRVVALYETLPLDLGGPDGHAAP